MTESPKSRFLKSDLAKSHADLASSKPFIAVMDVAMLQFVHESSSASDMATAATAALKLEGARKFALILMNLADKSPDPKPAPRDNLPHP
jgi:hypothetical protein